MKRTTLRLPDDLAERLDQERRQLDVSAAEVVRRALSAYLGPRSQPGPPAFIGIGRSGYRNTARDFDEILAREWTYEKFMERESSTPPDGREPDARVRSQEDHGTETVLEASGVAGEVAR